MFNITSYKSLILLLIVTLLASCSDSADEASQTDPIINTVPTITGVADPNGELTIIENATLTITLPDLLVTDQDNDYPADFTLHAQPGLNYTFVENPGNTEITVNPSTNYLGRLDVGVTVNDGDNSSRVFSVPVNVIENVAAIPAPTLNTITAGDGEITLNWSPVNGVSGYYIYHSNNPDFTKRNATRISVFNSATTFTVSGLQNKAVYYFRVAGYDSSDIAGPLSAETLSDFPLKPYSAMNWLHPSSSGHELWDIIWANNKYVAVGTTGRLLTSTNGTNWVIQNSGTTEDIVAVATNGNRFIAVGYENTILISTDTNANAWTRVQTSLSANADFSRVVWNGAQFVILAYDASKSYILKMNEDGTNQTTDATIVPTILGINDFIWTGSQYFAIGARIIYVSSDAVNWSVRADYTSTSDRYFERIKYLNGRILVVGGRTVVSSTTGASGDWAIWRNPTIVSIPNDYNTLDISYLDGRYFILYQYRLDDNTVFTSTNLTSWTETPAPYEFRAVAARPGGEFISVGDFGEIIRYSNAVNPVNSKVTDIGEWADFQSIASNGTHHVLVGNNIMHSSDGVTWNFLDRTVLGTSIINDFTTISEIKWMNDRFFIIGAEGVATSVDGQRWTLRDSAVSGKLGWNRSTANPLYIAVNGATAYTSTDGITWNPEATNTSVASINNVTWIGDGFMAVGPFRAYIVRSSDGTWSQHTLSNVGSNYHLYSIASDGNVILVEALDGVYRSVNRGDNWQKLTPARRSTIWDGSTFVSITNPYPGIPTITVSPDGFHFREQGFYNVEALPTAIAPAGNKYYVAGRHAQILEIIP